MRRALTTFALCVPVLFACACFTYIDGPGASGQVRDPLPWVLTPDAAVELADGRALVLDARPEELRTQEPVSRARVVSWQQLSEPDDPRRGMLLEDLDALSGVLRGIGVSQNQDVIVLGDPLRGWGESGRIVWSLRVMGHERVAFVDGGAPAFIAAGGSEAVVEAGAAPGDFVARPFPEIGIDGQALQAALDGEGSGLVLLDTRERREFDGQTPYGESRGGHVPGAVHLYFKDLLDDDGFLLSSERIDALLTERGVSSEDDIVAYCTGGVRSAFVVAALIHLGYPNVRNYPASMWEWSAQSWPLN